MATQQNDENGDTIYPPTALISTAMLATLAAMNNIAPISSSSLPLRLPPKKREVKAERKQRPIQSMFPFKLYDMLECIATGSLANLLPRADEAVGWSPDGISFSVHNEEVFMESVILHFFRSTRIASFYRQLQLWGFERIASGKNTSEWVHESFLRGHPEGLKNIYRTKIKGNDAYTSRIFRSRVVRPRNNSQAEARDDTGGAGGNVPANELDEFGMFIGQVIAHLP